MAMLRTFETVGESIAPLRDSLITVGQKVAPRGQETLEIEDMTIVIERPTYCLADAKGRMANPRIAVAEALQLVGGFSDPAMMLKISPNFGAFMDGGVFYGAYGPRMQSLLPKIVSKLMIDPYSRQAIAIMWRPHEDLNTPTKDLPCTLSFGFRIRNGVLNMTTHMRSNDLFWGWTYDATQFCFLQLTMARILDVGVGTYTHHADSFHSYLRDANALERVQYGSGKTRAIQGLAVESAADMRTVARDIFYGTTSIDRPDNKTEDWMSDIMKQVRDA